MSRNIAPFPQYRPGRVPYMQSQSMNPSIPWSQLTTYAYARRDWKLLKSLRYIKNPLTITSLLNNSSKIYYLTKFIDDMVLKGWIQRRLGFRTKRYGGKKRFAKRTQGLATKDYVKKQMSRNNEMHHIITNTTLTSTLASASYYSTLLNGLVQGDTDNNRTSDRVKFHNFSGKLSFHVPAGVQGNYRITIVRYKQPRGTSATLADIFSASPSVFHQYNDNNIDFNTRYDIIRDFTVEVQTAYASQTMSKLVDISFNANELISDYSLSNIGSIADIDKNAYFLMLQSDISTNTTVNISSTFNFKDM